MSTIGNQLNTIPLPEHPYIFPEITGAIDLLTHTTLAYCLRQPQQFQIRQNNQNYFISSKVPNSLDTFAFKFDPDGATQSAEFLFAARSGHCQVTKVNNWVDLKLNDYQGPRSFPGSKLHLQVGNFGTKVSEYITWPNRAPAVKIIYGQREGTNITSKYLEMGTYPLNETQSAVLLNSPRTHNIWDLLIHGCSMGLTNEKQGFMPLFEDSSFPRFSNEQPLNSVYLVKGMITPIKLAGANSGFLLLGRKYVNPNGETSSIVEKFPFNDNGTIEQANYEFKHYAQELLA